MTKIKFCNFVFLPSKVRGLSILTSFGTSEGYLASVASPTTRGYANVKVGALVDSSRCGYSPRADKGADYSAVFSALLNGCHTEPGAGSMRDRD